MVNDPGSDSTIVNISPKKIKPNPDNPRILFYEDKMDILKKSINEHGILVPLTVFYDKSHRTKPYTILDGERRWTCSTKLEIDEVPCIVYPKPTRQENIIYMFQIHNTREEWELVPTALKLEVLMRALKTRSPSGIGKITGLKPARVKDCLRVLEFPKKYLDLTIIRDPKRRIRGEFLSELEEWLEKFTPSDYKQIGMSKWNIVDAMIAKYQKGIIKNLLTEFRLLRKVVKNVVNESEKKKVNESIRKYIKSSPVIDKKTRNVRTPAMSAQDLFEDTTFNVQAEEDIIKISKKLYDILYQFDINEIRDQKNVKSSLKRLKNIIEEILSV